MASTAQRRNRGSCPAAALLLAACAFLSNLPIAFVGPVARPTAPRRSGAAPARVARAARGGEAQSEGRLRVGTKVKGIVAGIRPHGAFVDIGAGSAGFLRLSEVSAEPVGDIRNYLEEGQHVDVWIKAWRGNTIHVTMLDQKRGLDLFSGEDPATWHRGVVRKLQSYGAFVDVTLSGNGANGEGLVHVSQMKEGFVENVEDEVEVGQEVQVRVLSVNLAAGTMSLSMREQSPFVRADPAAWHKGVVKRLQPYGAWIEATLSETGATGEGMVHVSQIKDGFLEKIEDEVKVGQEVQVRVVSVDEAAGKMSFSMRKQSPFIGVDPSTWHKGIVQRVQPFGAFVEVTLSGNGAIREGMVHVAQIKDRPIKNIEDEIEVGQEVQVRVVSVDEAADKMVLSMREADVTPDVMRKHGPSASARPSRWHRGVVKRLESYGAFVDATVPGLVHVSQMKESFGEIMEGDVEVGQEVPVRVLSVDEAAGTVELSMREPSQPTKRRNLSPFVVAGSAGWHKGVVKVLLSYGAIVKVTLSGNGATEEGLVHVSQIKDGLVEDIEDEVRVGQEVQVRILSVDEAAGKMSLSMRKQSPFVGVDPATWHKGVVKGLQPYGAFVKVTSSEIGATGEGMVHVSQIKDGLVEFIQDEVRVGQEVQVRVMSVDEAVGKMSLSMRKQSPFVGVDPATWHKGVVHRVESYGALVEVTSSEIGATGEGMVHVSRIKDGLVKNIEDEVKVGQEVQVRVLTVDEAAGKMSLSMRKQSPFVGVDPAIWHKGVVQRLQPFAAWIDVTLSGDGAIEEGMLHVSKMKDGIVRNIEDELQVGQEVKVRVLSVDDAAGTASLSMLDIDFTPPVTQDMGRDWFKGNVKRLMPYGALVDVSLSGLVHVSQMMDGLVEHVEDAVAVGQEVQVRPLFMNDADGALSLSMREPVVSKDQHSLTPFVSVGSANWHSGVVKVVLSHGAIVEVILSGDGATGEGFVHESQIREGSVEKVEDEFRVGQEVQVRVLSVNETAGKMSLSMREQSPFARADPATWHKGVVKRLQPFGAWIDVTLSGDGAIEEGMVHMSRIKDGLVKNIEDEVKVGQEVQVRVLTVDEAAGKMDLSMLEQSPFARVDPATWHQGVVKRLQPYGAFVEVTLSGNGATGEGMVPLSKVTADLVENIEEEVKVGQAVQVRVSSFDEASGRMDLSMRETGAQQVDLTPFEAVAQDHWLLGKVLSIFTFGAFVAVAAPVSKVPARGLVHNSRMVGDVAVGDDVKVRVDSVDVGRGRLGLSMEELSDQAKH